MKYIAGIPKPDLKSFRVYFSLLLGISFGLSIYSYWLVNLVPPTSLRIAFYTVAAGFLGAVGYYFLFELWLAPRFSKLTRHMQVGLIGAGILIGFVLVFVGTDARDASSSYLTFLLPTETLKIAVSPSPQTTQTNASIYWFKTSTGDVSYNALNYRGWGKNDYELVLDNPSSNTLEWKGRPGEQVTIMFGKSPQGGVVNLSWNGQTEMLNLMSQVDGKYSYTHTFAVPFYASRSMALLLLIINFIVVCCALTLLIWENRIKILERVSKSFSASRLQKDEGKMDEKSDEALGKWAVPDWVYIIVLIAVAILLRVFNLDSLNPYQDEYAHLIAAKQIFEGASLNPVYHRSLFIVTLPVVFFFRLLGPELWSARLVGVLINVLGIVPLYLLARKINKPVAILSGSLYATNPWIISVARNVREYGYYPLFFYLIAYGMVVFIEQFPDHFVLIRDWRKLLKPKLYVPGLLLLLPILYSVFVDPTATFQIILIAYGALGLYLLLKVDLRNRVNVLVLLVFLFGIISAGYYYILKQGNVSLIPNFTAYPFRYFFSNPQQQWFFDRPMIVPVIAFVGGIVLGLLFYRSNFVPSFFFALFMVFVIFFTLFFNRNIRPRYIINVEYWYLILIAIGMYGIWVCLQSIFPNGTAIKLLISLALLFMTVNIGQILLPTLYSEQGYMPITEEYHFNVTPAYSFLLNKVNGNDVLVSNVYRSYVLWMGKPTFKAIYPFNFYTQQDPQNYILSIVDQYNSGWIVLDGFLYGSSVSFPRSTTSFKNKTIEYLGTRGDEYIWKWSVSPSK